MTEDVVAFVPLFACRCCAIKMLSKKKGEALKIKGKINNGKERVRNF